MQHPTAVGIKVYSNNNDNDNYYYYYCYSCCFCYYCDYYYYYYLLYYLHLLYYCCYFVIIAIIIIIVLLERLSGVKGAFESCVWYKNRLLTPSHSMYVHLCACHRFNNICNSLGSVPFRQLHHLQVRHSI